MSDKNRKKKLRKITVEGEVFLWSVTDFNHDGDGGCKFRIWKNKNLIYSSVFQGEESSITPSKVLEKIKVLKGLGAVYRDKFGKKEKV